ncbi:MAG: hypothetical protein HZA52_15460 [Planctomycetes bacterium]|nr:hypothetical protein [Planctomycetota bacterium]
MESPRPIAAPPVTVASEAGAAGRWVFDPARFAALGGAPALAGLVAFVPRAWLRRVAGRETFLWPEGDADACVVKRVRASRGRWANWGRTGREPREWWYELLHRGRVRAAGCSEAENLRELGRAGFPVPRPIAAASADGVSLVLMEKVGHDSDLASALAEAPRARREAWLAELAELVARLHAAGFYHRDLYLQHVVLPRESRGGASFVLLDCGRVRRERSPRERWFVKDLAALAHSVPTNVGADEWRAFVARYRERRGAGLELEPLLAAIDAKRARLAAHAPRHVDPDGGKRSRA